MPPPMGGRRGFNKTLSEEEKKNMPKITKALLLRVFSYLKPYKWHLFAVFVGIVLSAMLGVVPSMLTGRMIDDGLYGKNLSVLIKLVGLSFLVTVGSNLLGAIEVYISAWVSQHIAFDMKNQMYAHLQKMPQKFFTTNLQGDIITRMTGDINGVQSVISNTMSSIFSNLCTVVVTVYVLFSKNWMLALIGCCLVPFMSVPSMIVGKKRWKLATETQEQADKMNQILNETLSVSGQQLTKLFTREKDDFRKYKEVNTKRMQLSIRERMAGMWFRRSMRVITSMGPLVIYLLGGFLIIKFGNTSLSIGDITVIVTLLNKLYHPVDSLFGIHVDIIRSMALFTRVFEYYDMPVEIESPPNAIKLENPIGEIEFCDVHFRYNEDKEILKGISFKLSPGKMVAIVGTSGAGKTTISSLIPRLYDVESGEVRFDGIDVRKLDLESLRSNIAVVTQESYLFNATIRENLLFAKPDATDDEIISACKDANIHNFIMTLPEGYDTIVGNRGFKLSGGEKQRVSIARAILKNPVLLILDEATSSLDSISESAIQEALVPLLTGRTALVIAHRLSTIMAADEIIVIDSGKISERGTHSELLQHEGTYKVLYETQFRHEMD